jgi:hypothetical protein
MCGAVLCGSVALADTVTYTATGISSGGETQNASAIFVTGPGTITITLNNLLSNPQSIGQNISDLFFSLSNAVTSGTLVSSSGTELRVKGNRSYTIGSTVDTGWALTSSGNSLLLELLGTREAPRHTIIGPSNNGTYFGGIYSRANSSIKGNGPHNPFLESGVTFSLAVPGVTAATTVTSATFSFGTLAGDTLAGTNRTLIPEPSTWTLFLIGITAGFGLSLRRRKGSKRGRSSSLTKME